MDTGKTTATRETEMAAQETGVITYTDAQATDEALLLFVRKVRRLHPDAYSDVIARIPELARWALTGAENRADLLRAYDQRDGITREYPNRFADIDGEDEDED